MRNARALVFVTVGTIQAFAVACGGNVVVDPRGATGTSGAGASSTGSNSSTTTTSGGGSTCTGLTGECQTDADCGGETCAPVTPGGYRVCLAAPPPVATSCSMPFGGTNECCTTADCPMGRCYSTDVFPSCGGPAPPEYNTCLGDGCATNADCPASSTPQVCVPANSFGSPVRTCVTGYCNTDADCTAEPCGKCAPVTGPCCSVPSGLGCVYPGGCMQNSDCGDSNSCELDPKTGRGTCVAGIQPCPV